MADRCIVACHRLNTVRPELVLRQEPVQEVHCIFSVLPGCGSRKERVAAEGAGAFAPVVVDDTKPLHEDRAVS
jgi:hypothetical protein